MSAQNKIIFDPKKIQTRQDLINLLSIEDPEELKKLYSHARDIKNQEIGNKVYYRGIIEFSNICAKDCYYCGIRKSNQAISRYTMKKDEILKEARWAYEAGYGSIVIQGGEIQSEPFTGFIEDILIEIKKLSDEKLGITLSLGEQSPSTFQRWYDAGAHRYLIRIETSNQKLYSTLHPTSHRWEDRFKSLKALRESGYQVGTGVMIGLPGQQLADLADDILFFKEFDIDMIGMGPFIPHHQTPLAGEKINFDKKKQLELGLKMIAVTRLFLKDINIAATTALQALNPTGREMGIEAGANIVMPNLTETQYRAQYQLYNDKPCLDENSTQCRSCLGRRIASTGDEVGYNQWGDSPHFLKRSKK